MRSYAACQAPLFMGFSRKEYWNGLPCAPPGDLTNPGVEPLCVLHWQTFTTSSTWEAPPECLLCGDHRPVYYWYFYCCCWQASSICCLFRGRAEPVGGQMEPPGLQGAGTNSPVCMLGKWSGSEGEWRKPKGPFGHLGTQGSPWVCQWDYFPILGQMYIWGTWGRSWKFPRLYVCLAGVQRKKEAPHCPSWSFEPQKRQRMRLCFASMDGLTTLGIMKMMPLCSRHLFAVFTNFQCAALEQSRFWRQPLLLISGDDFSKFFSFETQSSHLLSVGNNNNNHLNWCEC